MSQIMEKGQYEDLDDLLSKIVDEALQVDTLLDIGPDQVDTLLSAVKRKEVFTHKQLLNRFKSMRAAGDNKIAKILQASNASAGKLF